MNRLGERSPVSPRFQNVRDSDQLRYYIETDTYE